jgi:hypothetical protein
MDGSARHAGLVRVRPMTELHANHALAFSTPKMGSAKSAFRQQLSAGIAQRVTLHFPAHPLVSATAPTSLTGAQRCIPHFDLPFSSF